MKIPEFLTHYYDSDRKPFLNIMDLTELERLPILDSLNLNYEKKKTARAFPAWYLIQRKKAEEKLRDLYIKKGGKPERVSPHYFTLGKSERWENTYLTRTKSITISMPVESSDIFFSIGDSLWCFAESEDPNQKFKNQWFQGELFKYSEVKNILNELNIDLHNPDTLQGKRIGYVEAFIWSDRILTDLLAINQVTIK